ncbi:phosphonate degradation HD-domain oxygenase [Urbifossiella limnaea]|uniref:HD domain protein n=1 Tax=Urbifossiella limnaea TaxID=2528023 RepID=A0A517Y1U9_9BACT|nr:phosphonate degradation HD-domain oxygenase [Urbifossiella limnaea]QDU23726.1 HD domain protein [Urbifossiella limnaea]
MPLVDAVFRLFAERGSGLYFGEAVTETEHALQTAHLAEAADAAPPLVAAALLHDVGHLLHTLGEDVAERGIDGRHEDIGAAWLAKHFGPAVADPVRLHVAAKRYLCAAESDYLGGLSPASRRSLELQGGPFTSDEQAAFRAEPHWQAALALRRWDDAAKVPGLAVPGVEHYRPHLEAALKGTA